MFAWNSRPLDCAGNVFFRGTLPPRLENFTQLKGLTVQPLPAKPDLHWSAEITHPKWGKATLLSMRNTEKIPRFLVEHDPRLSKEDRDDATSAGSCITIRMEGARKNILRDRKIFLRFLNLLMGDDGLIVMDIFAMRFWTRRALAEELIHDADLDVEALFISHAITPEGYVSSDDDEDERPCTWLHTHGLAELGTLDFDIIRPSPLIIGAGYDTVRALAYTLLEKGPSIAGTVVTAFHPDGEVALISVEQFNKSAPAADREPRGDPAEPLHNQKRVILCDPQKRRLFGLFPPGTIRASHALSTVESDHMMAIFPTSATNLMAQRARQTFHLFAGLAKEFEEFEAKAAVKMGYPIDGSTDAEDNREHMWFEVHSFGKDSVDATLMNQPFNIASMKEGDRAKHSIERLTDWALFTPAGQINPRSMMAAHLLREHGPKIREAMARARADGDQIH